LRARLNAAQYRISSQRDRASGPTIRSGQASRFLQRRHSVISPQLTAVLFLVAQICDGLLTYAALQYFGPTAEGNPLLSAWISLIGPGSAIVGAKVLAVGCGVVLYVVALHRVLLALTVFYAAAAVGPWLAIFHRLG
jgi:hypothetical protein